jgi:hypothetical protein
MENCCIGFSDPIPAAIRAAYYKTLSLTNVAFMNVEGPLVQSFGGDGAIELQNVAGIYGEKTVADEPYVCKSI